MRTKFHRSTMLVIAMLAIGVVIGWWAWPDSETFVGARNESGGTANLESGATTPNETGTNPGRVPKSAAPNPKTVAVQTRDALLASLRSKVEAPNVVPKEALLTFRSAEARDRFMREAATHGLEVLDTIPQLNAARVRYDRLE